MARMSVDDRFLRDPRVTRMAASLGWSKYEARGRLLDVFAIVYDQVNAGRKPLLTATDIDTAAEFVGLAAAMIAHDLAVNVGANAGELLHVRGSNDHTGYLKTRKSSGRAGGIKSGESRRNKAKQTSKVTFAETEGRPNPLPLVLPSALPLDQQSVREVKPRAAPVPGLTEARDHFHQRYLAAYGSAPSWNGIAIAHVKTLLKGSTLPEFVQRTDRLFDAPPAWLKPPFDIGTLVSQWNKLVTPAQTKFAVIPTRQFTDEESS